MTFCYKNNYPYSLTKPYETQTGLHLGSNYSVGEYVILQKNGIITIANGYSWDGATGGIDTATFMEPSLVHDALCQLIYSNKLGNGAQAKADKLLHEMCIDNGMSKIRAAWVYWTVRAHSRLRFKQ